MDGTVHISGQIEPLTSHAGNENVRLLEESLRGTHDLHDTRLTIRRRTGPRGPGGENLLRSTTPDAPRRPLSAAEVKSLMRVATTSRRIARGMFEHGRTRFFRQEQVTPKNASQRRYMEEIEESTNIDVWHGPGRDGERRTSPWPCP